MPKIIGDLFSVGGVVLALILGFMKEVPLVEGVLISAIPLVIGYVNSRLPVFLNLLVVKDKEFIIRTLAGLLFGQTLIALVFFGIGAGIGHFFK